MATGYSFKRFEIHPTRETSRMALSPPEEQLLVDLNQQLEQEFPKYKRYIRVPWLFTAQRTMVTSLSPILDISYDRANLDLRDKRLDPFQIFDTFVRADTYPKLKSLDPLSRFVRLEDGWKVFCAMQLLARILEMRGDYAWKRRHSLR